ncbi:proline racemase family protein [Mesobacillus zeae]|uniref:Proline racemase n=1 Tax=Mesobacillus zeae TaxID=1917180 RepID=A0A398AVP4_9BACI|nr:proline racemase family protein [Mesobacillus zeae]RID81691.1 proline racemase [Mesobacillus zeae]
MKINKNYSTIDVHVAGEVFRIIKELPFLHYESLIELDMMFPAHYEKEKNLLLNEPRGFAGLNGCLITPPFNKEANAAILFFNHDGTVPIQYGGLVAVITALLECGHIQSEPNNLYKLETINGLVSVCANLEEEEVVSVQVSSGLFQIRDKETHLYSPYGQCQFTLVQSNQLYAVFEKKDFPFELCLGELVELNKWGRTILYELQTLTSLSGVILMDSSKIEEGRIKSITFRPDRYILRSPGFESTMACLTSLLAKERINGKAVYVNESIFGSELEARVESQTEASCKFSISSRGFITGMQTFILDPTDPLASGFLLK